LDIKSAIVLGVVQGLTEFLPVSSSGHLVLLQKVFGISEPALLFDTMLHMGTLLAVFVVLRRDILAILRRIIQPLTGFLILATIPAVLAALIFEDHIEAAFESGRFLGFSFLLTSALLVIAELLSRRTLKNFTTNKHEQTRTLGNFTTEDTEKEEKPRSKTEEKKMTIIDALVIGVLQSVAIIPGVSRSGATISGALSRGLDRDFAARFSFLLSIPAILGALVFQLKDLVTADVANGAAVGIAVSANGETIDNAVVGYAVDTNGIFTIAAGTVAAAIVGFFAIRLMLKIVRERSLFGFAIYTAILGALVIVDQFVTHLVF
jgi:undecaprenyl-diphosphatase